MRLLPATSDTAVFQVLSEVHVIDAPVAVPVSVTSLSADVLVAPKALFQLPFATAPAVSALAISVVLAPRKLMLSAAGLAVLTPKVAVAEWVTEPLDPLKVRDEVPAGVLPIVVTVSVEVPEPVIAVG